MAVLFREFAVDRALKRQRQQNSKRDINTDMVDQRLLCWLMQLSPAENVGTGGRVQACDRGPLCSHVAALCEAYCNRITRLTKSASLWKTFWYVLRGHLRCRRSRGACRGCPAASEAVRCHSDLPRIEQEKLKHPQRRNLNFGELWIWESAFKDALISSVDEERVRQRCRTVFLLLAPHKTQSQQPRIIEQKVQSSCCTLKAYQSRDEHSSQVKLKSTYRSGSVLRLRTTNGAKEREKRRKHASICYLLLQNSCCSVEPVEPTKARLYMQNRILS